MDGKMNWMLEQSPVLLALLATGFTWLMTALGAGTVFFFRDINRRVMNTMLGFAAGIMMAASFWSLLAPAIARAEGGTVPAWLAVALGFLAGAGLPALFARIGGREEGETRRMRMLAGAVTLHNIPEGLAVGVAFGALASPGAMTPAALTAAVSVAVGIGLQNFPEGAAVAVPLRRAGLSRRRCFAAGQFSGAVEPLAGGAGALMVMLAEPILPYALAFAAGAMIYVVVEELLPEIGREGTADRTAAAGCILGFALMMVMDVALG